MIIDLDFHRRQKLAEEREGLVPEVHIIFDVMQDTDDYFGLHPDAVIYSDSKNLVEMIENNKNHKLRFCHMMRDYFDHFAKQIEDGNKKIQFVMNYIQE